MINIIKACLELAGIKWKLDNDKRIQPDTDDIQRFLVRAGEELEGEHEGDRLESGGLIVEKVEEGLAVYVFTGVYKI